MKSSYQSTGQLKPTSFAARGDCCIQYGINLLSNKVAPNAMLQWRALGMPSKPLSNLAGWMPSQSLPLTSTGDEDNRLFSGGGLNVIAPETQAIGTWTGTLLNDAPTTYAS